MIHDAPYYTYTYSRRNTSAANDQKSVTLTLVEAFSAARPQHRYRQRPLYYLYVVYLATTSRRKIWTVGKIKRVAHSKTFMFN